MSTLAELDLTREGVFVGLPMPLTLRVAMPITDDELIAFSQCNKPWQIERNAKGELEIMSPVGFEGSQRELFVMRSLGNWAEEHGGVCASSSAGFTLPDSSVRSPDASWVSDSRVRTLTPNEKRRFPPICPEFLIEILSESDSRAKLEAKMQIWMDHGAKLAWMIDPFTATVSVYRPDAEVEVLIRPEFVDAGEPVLGFRLKTSPLWADAQ
jgi:Uma2 family endonuclease